MKSRDYYRVCNRKINLKGITFGFSPSVYTSQKYKVWRRRLMKDIHIFNKELKNSDNLKEYEIELKKGFLIKPYGSDDFRKFIFTIEVKYKNKKVFEYTYHYFNNLGIIYIFYYRNDSIHNLIMKDYLNREGNVSY